MQRSLPSPHSAPAACSAFAARPPPAHRPAAWLRFGAGAPQLCCCSPERFLRGDRGGLLEAKPIKGTAPRHPADPQADARSAAELAGGRRAASVVADLRCCGCNGASPSRIDAKGWLQQAALQRPPHAGAEAANPLGCVSLAFLAPRRRIALPFVSPYLCQPPTALPSVSPCRCQLRPPRPSASPCPRQPLRRTGRRT